MCSQKLHLAIAFISSGQLLIRQGYFALAECIQSANQIEQPIVLLGGGILKVGIHVAAWQTMVVEYLVPILSLTIVEIKLNPKSSGATLELFVNFVQLFAMSFFIQVEAEVLKDAAAQVVGVVLVNGLHPQTLNFGKKAGTLPLHSQLEGLVCIFAQVDFGKRNVHLLQF
jgi:hypothetical protein